MSVEVFISYCHADETFRTQLDAHLALLQRQGLVSTWHDRMISPGESWAARINHALNHCRIVLLLVSADFVRSEYCWGVEMKRALERHEAGDAVVVPIALRRCDWTGAPFAHIQALPRDAKPVADWPKRDHAWTDVAKGLRGVVSPRSEPAAAEPPPPAPPRDPSPPPPPPSRPRQAPAPAGTVLDRFMNALVDEGGKAFAREGGKLLARHGVKGLMDALSGEGVDSQPTSREDLVAALLETADHGLLGDILRSHGFAVPRSKAGRARAVADSMQWDAALVDAAFTAPLLKNLCEELELPTGSKARMAASLVDEVDSVTG